jgi:hypothetical protein
VQTYYTKPGMLKPNCRRIARVAKKYGLGTDPELCTVYKLIDFRIRRHGSGFCFPAQIALVKHNHGFDRIKLGICLVEQASNSQVDRFNIRCLCKPEMLT